MENEKILKLAIKKAINNNFLGLAGNPKIEINVYLTDLNDIPVDPIKEPEKEICIISDWATHSIEGEDVDCEPECCGTKRYFSVNDLLFNEIFAKCFFGEELREEEWDNEGNCFKQPEWQYNLQKLATESDKIKYLEQFL